MSKILAVDLGNYNVNTSEDVIFKATFTEGEPINSIGEEILTIGDKVYCMDKETAFEYKFNKQQKNYLPNLLYAIHKSTDEEKVKLVLGVPADNLGISNDFKSDLEGRTFEFKINNIEKKVTFQNVGVVAEGVSSYFMLSAAQRKDKDIMIIDIGGRTVNVVTFRNNKNEFKKTLTLGMIDFYNTVKERYNSKGNNINTEQVYSFITKGLIEVDHQDELRFVNSIFNEIESIVKDRRFYDIYLTGGGSLTLEDTLKEIEPRAKLMDNALFTNVNGNAKIGVQQWRGKE